MNSLLWRPPKITHIETAGGLIRLRSDPEADDSTVSEVHGPFDDGIWSRRRRRKISTSGRCLRRKGKHTRGRGPSDGDQVLRPSLRFEQPIHFRYDWECNLLANVKVIGNKALPLVSQRSDDWGTTEALQGVMNDESARPVSREELAFLSRS